MFRYLISAAVAMAGVIPAVALGVEVAPGKLSELIDKPAEVTELVVEGTIDARDIFFIADEMPALKSLDISGASIVAFDGVPVRRLSHYDSSAIPSGAFAGSMIESVKLSPALTIGDAAFAGSALKSVEIPAGSVIGTGAFAGSRRLESVSIYTSAIGDGAFAGCDALADAGLAGVTSIGASAFRNCSALASASGASNLREIGSDAFAGCSSLSTFSFPATLVSLGDRSFAGSGLRNADLSGCTSLRSIGDWTFSRSGALAEVRLPDSAESFGEGSFFDCAALVGVNIPVSCRAIAGYAFKGASVNADALITQGVSEVGDYVFSGNTVTSEVSFPATLERLGDHAMSGMTGLTKLYGNSLRTVPELGDDVWAGVNQPAVELHVLDAMYSDFKNAPQWKNFTVISSTGTGDILLSPQQSVRGRFEGYDLKVDFGGLEADEVELYDVAGVRLASVAPGSDPVVTVDTSAWQNRVYLVRVLMSDGSVVSLKLAR